MYTKHNILFFSCQLINNIISLVEYMTHTVIQCVSPFYFWQNIRSVHIIVHIKVLKHTELMTSVNDVVAETDDVDT